MEEVELEASAHVHTASMTGLPGFLQLPSEQRLSWVQSYPGVTARCGWRIAMFLMFSRPRTCIPGMLAYYLATVVIGGLPLTAVLVGMAVSYHISAIANLYNMYTDIAEDNENIPSRVFELGLYGRDRLLRDTHLLAGVVFSLSLLVNPWFAALTLAGLIGCQQYSFRPFRMKARARLGILYFANAVSFPYVSAAMAAPAKLHVFEDKRYCALALYLFVWFCAKGLIKNVPDYEGDRRAHVTTSATLSTSRRRAATIAAVATVLVYAAVAVPAGCGLLGLKHLIALSWLPVASFQAWRLVSESDQKSSNDMLRDDMFVSVGYLSTLIFIEQFAWTSAAVVCVGFAIMLLSDRLGLDTRRREDFELT